MRSVRVRAAQLFTSLRAGCVLQRVGRGTQVGVRRVAPEQRGGVQRAGERQGGVRRVGPCNGAESNVSHAAKAACNRSNVRQGGVRQGEPASNRAE